MKVRSLPMFLILSGCGSFLTYSHDGEVEAVMVDGKPDKQMRFVSRQEEEPIPPTQFGQWFISSDWAVAFASRWTDLPLAFVSDGPEYCTALGVDKNRMLHASQIVRYRDSARALTECPGLVWKDNKSMIGLGNGHSHSTLDSHGERASSQDATQGSPVLTFGDGKARIEMLRIAVHFFSGTCLMGINPKTGKEEPVPAQSLLFTQVGGRARVFLWTPLAEGEEGKINFIRVYKPAANDDWEEAGICWVDVNEIQQAAVMHTRPPVHCKPDDFWLR